MKRGALSAAMVPFQAGSTGSEFTIDWRGFDAWDFYEQTSSVQSAGCTTNAVYRDPSAWYHIVFAYDTTQATSTNRWKLYINGTQITSFSATQYPTQNFDGYVNSTVPHYIGIRSGTTTPFDGYLTEVNFIDGQALTPSAFGEFDAITGVWKPKKYTGTYGTNGFYLNFSDNSAATAAAIGKDYSGNGNNWTPNNISVTAGVTYDSMLDVPTSWSDGGNGRGNYPVLNPLATASVGAIPINGNLEVSQAASTARRNNVLTMALPTTGKWYMEVNIVSATVRGFFVGIAPVDTLSTWIDNASVYAFSTGARVQASSPYPYQSVVNGVIGGSIGLTEPVAGDVLQLKYDADTGAFELGKNNTFVSIATGLSGNYIFAFAKDSTTSSFALGYAINCGQRPFAYTPPTGFKALNTQNLPEPTIPNGRKYFDAKLWTGTGSPVTLTGVGFAPDLAWNKDRTAANSNTVYDTVRGVQKEIVTNATSAETTEVNGLTAFNSDGVTFGSRQSQNGNSQVTWLWKEGATNGFDIQAITAQSSGSATFAHSLGVAPAMYIVKPRANAGGWNVYHQSLGATKVLALNGTGAAVTSSTTWNNTAPTSSVLSLGTDYAGFGTQIVYLFAEVPGFSKFGSYTGNGSADGPFVFCGFRPRWIMIKRTDAAQNWPIVDTSRDTANVMNRRLFANLSDAEDQGIPNFIDVTANGFKCRDSNVSYNASGGTYIFAVFAENPFKYSLAR